MSQKINKTISSSPILECQFNLTSVFVEFPNHDLYSRPKLTVEFLQSREFTRIHVNSSEMIFAKL